MTKKMLLSGYLFIIIFQLLADTIMKILKKKSTREMLL